MSRRRLVRANAVLLLALGVLTVAAAMEGGPAVGMPADAQPPAASARPRGEYTMISGRIQGATTNAVYILDANNQELVALSWDRGRNRFVGIGYRSLLADGRTQPTGR